MICAYGLKTYKNRYIINGPSFTFWIFKLPEDEESEGMKKLHAEEYIPCLATISIGQDRKNTIEGSSATDKDYPIKTKW